MSIFNDHLRDGLVKLPDGVCCVCGHKLGTHLDEGVVWRCHSLGQDFYQCECALRKDRMISDDTINAYDLKRRLIQQVKELGEIIEIPEEALKEN